MSPSKTRQPRRGLLCPDCDSGQLRVVYTRGKDHGVVQRRRECRQCGCRVTTWEQILPRELQQCNDFPKTQPSPSTSSIAPVPQT